MLCKSIEYYSTILTLNQPAQIVLECIFIHKQKSKPESLTYMTNNRNPL